MYSSTSSSIGILRAGHMIRVHHLSAASHEHEVNISFLSACRFNSRNSVLPKVRRLWKAHSKYIFYPQHERSSFFLVFVGGRGAFGFIEINHRPSLPKEKNKTANFLHPARRPQAVVTLLVRGSLHRTTTITTCLAVEIKPTMHLLEVRPQHVHSGESGGRRHFVPVRWARC